MKTKLFSPLIFSVLALVSCQQNPKTASPDTAAGTDSVSAAAKGTFAYDLDFLRRHDSVKVLKNASGEAQIIVSAKYQAKVFTSTAAGEQGTSFGWVNYKAFDKTDPHMNGYGGEDRLWLGPEGNRYSLYFKPGAKMEFANWHTPAAFDTEKWEVKTADARSISLYKDMTLLNYSGTTLKLRVDRDIEVLENDEIARGLGIELKSDIKVVGFRTENTIVNTGDFEWTEKTGAPCLWNLDMFNPSPSAVIVIPYNPDAPGKPATTDYFGQIPDDRIMYKNGVLYFKADGKSRGKLGIAPQKAMTYAGSYDAAAKVLTVTRFDVDKSATYLNQEWNTTASLLKGDAVNAYNDGPLDDGTQMGPFYEIESVSPAAFLKPSGKLLHRHSVYHFTGNEASLDIIAKKLLNTSLTEIGAAFSR